MDDLIVYCFGPEKYLLGVNAANTDKDWEHICSFADRFGMKVGIDLVNASDDTCQLAIQGPKAMELMQKLCSEDIMDMPNYTALNKDFTGYEYYPLYVQDFAKLHTR